MKRIIWHWSAGGYRANAVDRRAYHEIIEVDGGIVKGMHPFEANAFIAQPGNPDTYAAHTRGINTGSIGLSMAGMHDARESPFSFGSAPITQAQVDVLVSRTAELCKRYQIPVTRHTTLSHAEVEGALGVWQRPRWDIKWLPGMEAPLPAIEVGNMIRRQVLDYMGRHLTEKPAPPSELKRNPIWSMFRRRR